MRANKEHYCGQISNGVKHGQGTFTYSHSYFKYEGEWRNNLKHGQGVLSLRDGTRYEGDFVGGEMTGKGVKMWPDGATYEGDFVEGEPHGTGSFQSPATGEQYTGAWCQGARQGEGVLKLPRHGVTYFGHFERHAFRGEGRLVHLATGIEWTGSFDGSTLTCNEARIALPNSVSYTGAMRDGQRHGEGVMMFDDGSNQLTYEVTHNADALVTCSGCDQGISISRVAAVPSEAPLTLKGGGSKLVVSKSEHTGVQLWFEPLAPARRIELLVREDTRRRSSSGGARKSNASVLEGAHIGSPVVSVDPEVPLTLDLTDMEPACYVLVLRDTTSFPDPVEAQVAEPTVLGEGPVHKRPVVLPSLAPFQPPALAETRVFLEVKE